MKHRMRDTNECHSQMKNKGKWTTGKYRGKWKRSLIKGEFR